jgi:hypothetical protein
MTVEILDPTKIQTLEAHIAHAETFEPEVLQQLHDLAEQLDGTPVFPILGAGASVDSGVRLAGQISQDLYANYIHDPGFPHCQTISVADQNESRPGGPGDLQRERPEHNGAPYTPSRACGLARCRTDPRALQRLPGACTLSLEAPLSVRW